MAKDRLGNILVNIAFFSLGFGGDLGRIGVGLPVFCFLSNKLIMLVLQSGEFGFDLLDFFGYSLTYEGFHRRCVNTVFIQ